MRASRRFHGPTIFLATTALGFAVLVPFAGCGGGSDTQAPAGATTATAGSGGQSGAGGGGTGGNALDHVCGNGKVEHTEDCDDGNQIDNDSCNNQCHFPCVKGTVNGDANCDDKDPCNGAETCNASHACDKGTAEADGTSCGDMKVCHGMVCVVVSCGDGFVTPPEECDDGNVTNGDGCDNCKFSCKSSDATACTPADACAGQGKCDDATHTCTAGTKEADGTACDMGFCKGGACVAAKCGNGVVDPGEQCDDGNAVPGDGCETTCKFSCSAPLTDCPAPAACQIASCDAKHVCATGADATKEGMTCGAGLVCKSGACIAPNATCGNGVKENGEDCDFGAQNGAGTGCEATCKFSCTKAPDSCPDANACNGMESCGAVTVNGQSGQKCSAGAPLAACAACAGGLCVGGSCAVSNCGDGCVDQAAGEQCEPPNTAMCSATCKTVVAVVCGNGTREAGEQCDDGNTTNLDGCDSACKFEQDQRINSLQMQNTIASPMPFCTKNALGLAVGGVALGQLQTGIDTAVKDGSTTILLKALDLDDLTGTADPMFTIGVMNGTPAMGMGYDGTKDLDWWYTADPMSYDASKIPLSKLPGSIAAKLLTAGPGPVSVNLVLAGSTAHLNLSNTRVQIKLNNASTPKTSMGASPGHVAAEHLDPALQSFESGGTNPTGELCGNVSAASLATVTRPAVIGSLCNQYKDTNSLLDVFVGGCLPGLAISVVQPDQVDPSAPVGGAGPPYTLKADATTHAVTKCVDKNNMDVTPLATCLNAAAYSTRFKIAIGRVIVK